MGYPAHADRGPGRGGEPIEGAARGPQHSTENRLPSVNSVVCTAASAPSEDSSGHPEMGML